jgi:hypothetical protein
VYTIGLSDLAAMRIHNRRVLPFKSARVRDLNDVIENCSGSMRDTPPLWLYRVLLDAQSTACRSIMRLIFPACPAKSR